MRFRSKDNAAIPVHRYIHDAPRYIMHDRGTIPPRFHYSFPTDTLYPSFSTYNLQYLSRAAIFPRTVRIFPNRIRTTTSKSRLDEETGVETSRFSLLLDHFPYTYSYITISYSFFYVLDLLGRKETRDRELSPLGRLERSKGGE